MNLFEVITKEEFDEASASIPLLAEDAGVGDTVATVQAYPRTDMIYCEFCKGWYYAEYHYGEIEE